MKLFLRRTDEEELIFIPSYLLVDNFEKLLRKKDIQNLWKDNKNRRRFHIHKKYI